MTKMTSRCMGFCMRTDILMFVSGLERKNNTKRLIIISLLVLDNIDFIALMIKSLVEIGLKVTTINKRRYGRPRVDIYCLYACDISLCLTRKFTHHFTLSTILLRHLH